MNEREKALLENQNKLKEIISYYHNNNVLMEIVTCREKIQDGEKWRFGRFIFDSQKHEALMNREGHYFLIVRNGIGIVNAKLISAKEIGNKKLVSWMEIFN